ncbi:protein of unknown function [Shewanella benthica]|uniref:Uncharacterized protein n=1 Tax=Shewanella benthica TaxID=43661 RepID=A0A330M3F8_9GAMM|nr:protein of unknown function [Shewanella benthica]
MPADLIGQSRAGMRCDSLLAII